MFKKSTTLSCALDKAIRKTYLINDFEEIGWLNPESDNLVDYKGSQPMVNHPWEESAYHESRMTPQKPPDMIYLPSKELI